MLRNFLFLCLAMTAHASVSQAETIHVLVWDEQQSRQAEAYENFIGNEIASRLDASSDNFELRSVKLNDPEQRLTAENLDWADVMI